MFTPSIETLVAIIAVGVAYWVYKNVKLRGGSEGTALAWALGVAFLPFVVLPAYFIFRPKRENSTQHTKFPK